MDVRLPSGTVIRNVPEGTSQADLRSKLLANGYDESIFSNVSKAAQPEIAPDNYPTLAAVADVPLSIGRGAVTGVKAFVDAFGADSPVSRTLSSVDTYLEDLMSAQSKKDSQEVSRIIDEAKDKGAWDQVKAGLSAFSVAPVDLLTNAFGTVAPTALAALLATFAAPAVGVGTGAAVVATSLGVGAVSGAGTVKDRIYLDVKQALIDQGVALEKAEAAAQQAQEYGGKNLDQIMLGALFGAGAAVSGAEAALVKGLTSKILGRAAQTATAEVGEQTAKGVGRRLVEGAVKEAVPEALQEGQEQVASNIAQQREGVDVSTFQGAGTSAALAGTIGAIMGGGLNVATTSGPRTVDKEAENAVLLKALETNRRAMDDNKFLEFASTLRDRVPVLGEILDSNVSRATKLSLIQSRIAEANIGGTQDQIDAEGPRGLPKPEIQRSENLRQVLNNTIDIADSAGVPLGDLTVNQGPEGWRIISPDSKIMSDPMPLGSEREANVVLEGIRRTHDERQTERYRAESDEYRRDFDKQMAEATVAAARESRTPFEPISLDEIYEYDPALFNKIYDSRLKDKSVATKEEVQAPVTIDEMRKRGAKRADINHFAIQQKPFTAGTGGLRPGIEDELYGVGVKPTESKPMAKTAEELARQKYAEVTPVDIKPKQVQDIEEEEAPSSPSQEAQDLRDAYTRLRTAGYTDEQIGGLTKDQFYNALVEGDGTEFSRSKDDRKSDKERKKINALYDQIEAGRDRRENGTTAPVKPLRSALAPELTDEEIADARKIIEDRVAKYEAAGKQGVAIGKGVRDAIANSDFTPNQLLQAFQVADISARLLGKTEADPHALEFVQRLVNERTGEVEEAGGARVPPSEKLKGLIKISLDKTYDPKSTTAHEAFHVLQDLFAAYDKAGAKIVNNAFKGATSFDDIDANLLRKLKSLRDPGTKNSVYDTLKEAVEDKGLLEGYDQATREREMQAYVFGYMDNAIINGNQNMGGLGAAFVRFLNYFRQFKDRVSNYFKGLGYNTAEDVFDATSRGTRQAGLGVEGELVRKALPGEDEEFSRGKGPSKIVTQQEKGEENEERYKQDRDGGRRVSSTGTKNFKALEGTPVVEGASGPNQNLISIAEKYAKASGFRLSRQAEYVKIDEDFATNIANAYEEMTAEPSSSEVIEAYNDLIRQTTDQYLALEDAGYKFYFFNPNSFDPYSGMPGGFGNPWNALRDLRANKTMAVFPTSEGYGTEGITDTDLNNNPMLQDTGMMWPDQDGVMQPVTANDLFRAVHDVFGHGLEGAGFRARGEENAYQAHVRLFYGPAVKAMTTETRGQNSWLNFGPYGEQNQSAKVEGTIFAQNKIGILPSWTWEDRIAASSFLEEEEFSRASNFDKYSEGVKTLGPDGKPLTVYRGQRMSDRSPTKFDTTKGRSSPSFASDPEVSNVYAGKRDTFPFAPQVGKYYMGMKNPLDIRNLGDVVSMNDFFSKIPHSFTEAETVGNVIGYDQIAEAIRSLDKLAANNSAYFDLGGVKSAADYPGPVFDFDTLADFIQDQGINGEEQLIQKGLGAAKVDSYLLADSSKIKSLLTKAGYDGIIHKDAFDAGAGRYQGDKSTLEQGSMGPVIDAYRPFKMGAVKSATGNRGTYDRKNPNPEYSRARRDGGEQVSRDLNDRRAGSLQFGLFPYLRSVATKVFDHPKMINLGSMNPGNAARQIAALDEIRRRYPNPLQSAAKFAEMLSYAFGSSVRDGTVPLVPYNAIRLANEKDVVKNQIGGLSAGQIRMAEEGFRLGARFKRLYQSGQMKPEHTAKMILWGILSRGVSPFVQESAFMDIVADRGNKAGVGHFIQAALDGRFNMEDYLEWTSYVMPDESPGNGTTHNLNAFGKTLVKLAEKLEDGRTVLETLHDAIKDYSNTGPQVRRTFHTINNSMGINNKVLSFVLLVTGRNDVLVLDRVQMRNLFNDGRFDDYNMYDGEKNRRLVKKRSGEESEEDAAQRGTSIAQLGNGAVGLLYYEALERGLISSIRTAYNDLNRGNGSAGQYHWESWVVSSAQEVDHGSIEGILRDAEGVVDPYFGVTTREGKFDTFNSGMIYGHDKEGNPYTELTDGLGNFYRFDPESAKAVLKRISKPSGGVIPQGFKVSQNETGPWFNNPAINQARLSQLLSQAGTLVRGNASPFSQANTNVNRPVLRTTGTDQSTARGGAGEVEFSRAAALTGDSVEEFKKWWKKSQAVDEGGQPKTYYTGKATTRLDKDGKPFKTFGRAGSGALVDAAGFPVRGAEGPYYFSPEPPFASQFAMRRLSKSDFKEKRSDQAAEGGRMIPAFLSVQNPFDYDNQDHVDQLLQDPELQYAIRNNRVYKAMIEMGMWRELEKREVQLAIRRAGFDGFYLMEQLPEFDDNNIATGKKIDSKNLAVYKASQIKSIFNEFKPGAAESREFSRAIAATKQEKEAEANSTRYFQVWDKAREFFNPLALVNNLPQFLSFRNVTTGTITMSEQYARKMADKIAKGSVEERQAVYKFMTTKAGDSSLIKDPEIRKAAIEAKKAIIDYAKLMVARKEMTQESFDNYYDKYLPRIYLLFEATNRGMKTPMGGTSVREYLDKRDEKLSEEYRKVLGEIKDPSYLTYIALSRPARDIAMSDYLNNLFIHGGDPKNQWIAPQSIVEYDGKKYTPYDLQHMADDLDSAAELAANLSEDQAEAMRKEASKMRRVALAAQGDLQYKLDEIRARGYQQIPTRRQYGVLAGAVVQKGIYQDLVGTFIPVGKDNPSLIERLIGDEHSAIQKANALWKLGKTTLNPPTQVVNFVSNAISLNLFGGVPIHKFPYLFKKTMNEIMKNGSMYQEAQKFGLTGGTMSKVELDRAFIRMQRYQAKVGGEGNLVNMFATSRAIGSAFIEKAGDAYQFSETLFKMMMYIHSVETDKMKPSEAVNAANEIMFDYSLVNNNIRWLRNAPLGLPFITYYYKVLPKIIETMYKHPQRFIPYIALAYALPAMTMAAFDLDDDELEKLRLSAQDYVRDSGTLFFLPFRDSKGNIQFVDVGKYLPFSSLLSPFITAFKYGNYTKAAFELTRPITPSGPVITTIAALATGNDPFTNRPIMDPRDTNKAQALALFSYIFNQAMPPVISMDFNNFEKSSGALPRVYNSLFVDGTGVDKRGMPKPELLESAARILGLNITPLKADVQRIQNINYMMSQINKTKSLMAQTATDQSLMPDRKREKNRELAEKVKEQVLEMQKYANDTANIGQITRKIKEAP